MRNQIQTQNKNQTPAQQQAKEASKKVNPQTTFATKEKPAEGNKADAKENLATDFLRKNFMKR